MYLATVIHVYLYISINSKRCRFTWLFLYSSPSFNSPNYMKCSSTSEWFHFKWMLAIFNLRAPNRECIFQVDCDCSSRNYSIRKKQQEFIQYKLFVISSALHVQNFYCSFGLRLIYTSKLSTLTSAKITGIDFFSICLLTKYNFINYSKCRFMFNIIITTYYQLNILVLM